MKVGENKEYCKKNIYTSIKYSRVDKLEFVKIADGFDSEYSIVDHIGHKLLMKTNHDAPKSKFAADRS